VTRSTAANRSTAPAFLALACVGFIASAPAALAADNDPLPGDGSEEQDRTPIVVTGQRGEELQGPKATAPVVNTPRK